MYRMKHRMRLRGNLKTYLRWPLFFGILLILMTIQLFSVSVRSGVIGIGYTILYSVMFFMGWFMLSLVIVAFMRFIKSKKEGENGI